MLDRAPDHDPVAVRRGHERVRLDRELGDHREGYVPSTTTSASRSAASRSPHAVAVLAEDVRARERVDRAERWVLDERRIRRQAAGHGVDRGQLLVRRPGRARGLLGRVERLGGDGGHRVAMVLRLAVARTGPVLELRARTAASGREVGGGQDEPDAGHGEGRAGVDPADARPRHVERDELHVEDVVEVDVGDVLLPPGDRSTPPTRAGDSPDRHWGRPRVGRRRSVADDVARPPVAVPRARRSAPPRAASTASKICS